MKWVIGDTVGGWTLDAPVAEKVEHVWFAHDSTGRQGVVKRPRGKGKYAVGRFRSEAQVMQRLTGEPGVLRLLDVESGSEPGWMVTERAQLLREHLGDAPNLRDVVAAFAQIAGVLERLGVAEGVAHRDLKPANLFWQDGHAVVGDFGIAAWDHGLDLTEDGASVGPRNYMAPEAREYDGRIDPFALDVYSLACSLWAIAAGRTVPPLGTLRADADEASLYPVGGLPAYRLSRLLEMCTAHRPSFRPRMGEVRDELRAWVDQHPPGSTPRPHQRRIGRSFAEFRGREVNAAGPQRHAEAGLQELLDSVRHMGPSGSDGSRVRAASTQDLVGQHPGLALGDPETWEPEWSAAKSLTWDDSVPKRVLAAGLEYGGEVMYLVEWQVLRDGVWVVHWEDRERARLRLPSDWTVRDALGSRIAGANPGS